MRYIPCRRRQICLGRPQRAVTSPGEFQLTPRYIHLAPTAGTRPASTHEMTPHSGKTESSGRRCLLNEPWLCSPSSSNSICFSRRCLKAASPDPFPIWGSENRREYPTQPVVFVTRHHSATARYSRRNGIAFAPEYRRAGNGRALTISNKGIHESEYPRLAQEVQMRPVDANRFAIRTNPTPCRLRLEKAHRGLNVTAR